MISQPPPPSITEDQSVPKEWLEKEQTYRTPTPPKSQSQSTHKRHGEHKLLLAGSQVRQPHTAISASSHMSSPTRHSCPSTSFPPKLIAQTSPPRKAVRELDSPNCEPNCTKTEETDRLKTESSEQVMMRVT